jgi:hypothetical protein
MKLEQWPSLKSDIKFRVMAVDFSRVLDRVGNGVITCIGSVRESGAKFKIANRTLHAKVILLFPV